MSKENFMWTTPVFEDDTPDRTIPRKSRRKRSHGTSMDELTNSLANDASITTGQREDEPSDLDDERRDPWFIKYSPKSSDAVAMNPSKINEVKSWLRSAYDPSDLYFKPIAVFSGPAGCGKSTLLRVLAEENNIKILEHSFNEDNRTDQLEDAFKEVFSLSQYCQFQNFLMDNARYASSKTTGTKAVEKKLILIEEIPIGFFRCPSRYHEILTKYLQCDKAQIVPIVFIISFNSTQEFPQTFKLFPVEVVERLEILIISFNSVAVTYLKKSVNGIEYFDSMSKEDQTSLLESCNGDIRSLFNSLELRCRNSEMAMKSRSSKKSRVSQPSLDSGRDASLNSFHFIGKMLHVKRVFDGDINFDGDFRVYPLHEKVESLLDSKVLPSNRLMLSLHQNYFKNVMNISDAASVVDNLSVADLFSGFNLNEQFDMTKYQDEISVRGTMYNIAPSLVDSDGEKIGDAKGRKKNSQKMQPLAVPTFNPCSPKGQLILQDRLEFSNKSKCTKEIESNCRDLIFKLRPSMHQYQCSEMFMDILPFITCHNFDSRTSHASVKLMQLFYVQIDSFVNYPEDEVPGATASEGIQWIPASTRKRLKSFSSAQLERQLMHQGDESDYDDFEEGDRIESFPDDDLQYIFGNCDLR